MARALDHGCVCEEELCGRGGSNSGGVYSLSLGRSSDMYLQKRCFAPAVPFLLREFSLGFVPFGEGSFVRLCEVELLGL